MDLFTLFFLSSPGRLEEKGVCSDLKLQCKDWIAWFLSAYPSSLYHSPVHKWTLHIQRAMGSSRAACCSDCTFCLQLTLPKFLRGKGPNQPSDKLGLKSPKTLITWWAFQSWGNSSKIPGEHFLIHSVRLPPMLSMDKKPLSTNWENNLYLTSERTWKTVASAGTICYSVGTECLQTSFIEKQLHRGLWVVGVHTSSKHPQTGFPFTVKECLLHLSYRRSLS